MNAPDNILRIFFNKQIGPTILGRDYHPFYIGIFNCLLVMLSYRFKSKNNAINICKVLFPVLLLVLISFYHLPFKKLLTFLLPSLKGIHIGHMAFLIYFTAFVLISYCFNELLSRSNEKEGRSTLIVVLMLIVFTLCFFTVVNYVHAPFNRMSVTTWKAFMHNPLMSVPRLSYMVLLFSSIASLILLIYTRRWKKVIGILLMIFMVSHMALFWRMSFTYGCADLRRHFEYSVERESLKSMAPWERMEILYGNKYWKWNQVNLKQGLTMNLPLFYGVSISSGQSPLHSFRDRILFDAINGRYPFRKSWYWKNGRYINDSGRAYLESYNVNYNLINVLGIKYIFSATELNNRLLQEIRRGSSYYIYKNLGALPRSYLVYKQEIMDDLKILDAMVNNKVELRQTALCSEKIVVENSADSRFYDLEPNVEFEVYSPNIVQLKVESPRSGILILTDTFYKGWKAYVDDEPTRIYRVNYKFRGISVSAGKHTVKFRYLPWSFFLGASISFATLIIVSLFFIKRRRKNL